MIGSFSYKDMDIQTETPQVFITGRYCRLLPNVGKYRIPQTNSGLEANSCDSSSTSNRGRSREYRQVEVAIHAK